MVGGDRIHNISATSRTPQAYKFALHNASWPKNDTTTRTHLVQVWKTNSRIIPNIPDPSPYITDWTYRKFQRTSNNVKYLSLICRI